MSRVLGGCNTVMQLPLTDYLNPENLSGATYDTLKKGKSAILPGRKDKPGS